LDLGVGTENILIVRVIVLCTPMKKVVIQEF